MLSNSTLCKEDHHTAGVSRRSTNQSGKTYSNRPITARPIGVQPLLSAGKLHRVPSAAKHAAAAKQRADDRRGKSHVRKPGFCCLTDWYRSFHVHLMSEQSRNGVVVRALVSHQCGPGSIPGCCFSSLHREVFLRELLFFPFLRNQHSQIPLRSGLLSSTLS